MSKTSSKTQQKISEIEENERTEEENSEELPEELGEENGDGGDFSEPSLESDDELQSIVPLEEKAVVSNNYQGLLKQYLAEISKYAILTPEEEVEAVRQLRESGDLDAAKRLVRANLRLVVKIAMEYRNAYYNILDLIQEGNLGLMKAVSKFDPSKGARLSYYASWWIRSYVLKYILDNFRLVRVGTTQAQKKLFYHLMREKQRLEAQGLTLEPKLLADKYNVREKDVLEMDMRLSSTGNDLSLNQPLHSGEEDSGRATHLDILEDDRQSADEGLEKEQLRKILTQNLGAFEKTLTEKEKAVFKERLAAENPKTLQEVADAFGLTRERARQIEVKVIEKMREFFQKYIR